MKNILIHIPHSSYYIPQEYKELFYLSETALFEEQLKMTDSFTDELFDIKSVERLICPVSRLVCDVERFRNKSEEIMTKQGMWVCYTKTSDKNLLKKVDENHEKEILVKYYDKHHFEFEQIVSKKLIESNQCLIIDAHSFASKPLPYELDSAINRPDICIGTDDFHTPKWLSKCLYDYFVTFGYKTFINSPFSGSIVPLSYYRKNKNVISVMIEINRSLYMDEKLGQKNDNYEKIKSDIFNLFKIMNTNNF